MKAKHKNTQFIFAILIALILAALSCGLPSTDETAVTPDVVGTAVELTAQARDDQDAISTQAPAEESSTPLEFTVLEGYSINSYSAPSGDIDGTFDIELTFTAIEERDGFLLVSWISDGNSYRTWVKVEDVEIFFPISNDTQQPEANEPEEQSEQIQPSELMDEQPVEPSEIIQRVAPFYLADGGYFDFDHASGIDGSAVIYDQPDPALPEIQFWNDQLISNEVGLIVLLGDTTAPGFEDCRSAPLGTNEIPSQTISVGTIVCFQTDLGNVGYFRVEDIYLDSYGDLVLGFNYTLWDANGSELSIDQALHTISGTTYPQGSGGKDLDFYRNSRVVDITFEQVSNTQIQIVPASSVQIALWGSEIPSYQNCADLALGMQPVPVELEAAPDVMPVKEPLFLCFRTDEARLGRLYVKWVYSSALSAPLPYGDPWGSADFSAVYEGGGILVEYYADTWVLENASPSNLVPQRAAAGDSSGRIVLPFSDTFDFDIGSSLIDPRSISDIQYLVSDSSGEAIITPWHESILLAPWGNSSPGYEDCRSANLLNNSVPIELGTNVCYKTSTGRFGFYQVNDLYFEMEAYFNNNAKLFVDLSYTLWALDGQTLIIHQPVQVLDDGGNWLFPGQYDLDLASGAQNTDITFEADSPVQVSFVPAQGTGLAYWGLTLPNYTDCTSIILGGETLSVEVSSIQNFDIPGYNKLAIPTFFCYQTDEGRFGRLEFEGTYHNLDTDEIYLMILAETW
ncbi:MAG: hypothetical protein H8D34_04235 [Chloroflexi bacterium]|nr:hypothetical protein [Chloroflexota bacterium]